jgi:hypothetical protein
MERDDTARAEKIFPYMKRETPSEHEDIEGQETGGSEGTDDEREIQELIEAGDYEALHQSIRSDVEASGGTEEDFRTLEYFAAQADVADPSWQKFIADAALQIRRNARGR